MKKLSNKGFTLVELIIVIAILAIIMLIAIPNFSGIRQRMQVRADKATAGQIANAVRIWYTERDSEDLPVVGTGEGCIQTFGAEGAETVNYTTLSDIASYISTSYTPKSLSNSTTKAEVADSQYSVIMSSQDRAAKIVVIVEEAGEGEGAEKWEAPEGDLTVDYDGDGAGIAFIEA